MQWAYYIFAELNLTPLPRTPGGTPQLEAIVNTVLAVMGAIAVLIVVLAGFYMINSQGDPNKITNARNAIIYSLVGLAVIMFVFAIVNFVLKGVT